MESHISAFKWPIYFWPWPMLKVKINVMQISTVTISVALTDRANIYCYCQTNRKLDMDFSLAYLDLTFLILKVKVMHTSTVNISKMLADGENITIAFKHEVTYGLYRIYIWPWLILNVKGKVCRHTFRLEISWKYRNMWQELLLPSYKK